MNLEQTTELFGYMSIISTTVLIVSSILIMLLKDFVYKIHSKLFDIDKSNLAVMIYGILAIFI